MIYWFKKLKGSTQVYIVGTGVVSFAVFLKSGLAAGLGVLGLALILAAFCAWVDEK